MSLKHFNDIFKNSEKAEDGPCPARLLGLLMKIKHVDAREQEVDAASGLSVCPPPEPGDPATPRPRCEHTAIVNHV